MSNADKPLWPGPTVLFVGISTFLFGGIGFTHLMEQSSAEWLAYGRTALLVVSGSLIFIGARWTLKNGDEK